jgi:hypothetical protein
MQSGAIGALGDTAIRRSFDDSLAQADTIRDMMKSDFIKEPNVMKWSPEQVISWLTSHGLAKYTGKYCLHSLVLIVLDPFKEHQIDGPLLLRIDQSFVRDVLNVHHPLFERRFLRYLEDLKELQLSREKVGLIVFIFLTVFRTRLSTSWMSML